MISRASEVRAERSRTFSSSSFLEARGARGHHRPFMPPSPSTTALALASVLSPTTKRKANGKSLDEQWEDLASFLKGAGSVLASWLAIGQMHAIYVEMRLHKSADERRLQNLSVGHFVERACKATGLSRPTIYNYVERARTLVEALGPVTIKAMLSGKETISNDENLLLKLAQLPAPKVPRNPYTNNRWAPGKSAVDRGAGTPPPGTCHCRCRSYR